MSKRGTSEDNLIKKARSFESELKSGEFRALLKSSQELAKEDLTEEERKDLEMAKSALYFINEVRNALDRLASKDESKREPKPKNDKGD